MALRCERPRLELSLQFTPDKGAIAALLIVVVQREYYTYIRCIEAGAHWVSYKL